MTTLRFCADGGSVVGGDRRLPPDLCEYQHPQVNAVTGCNRLQCANCGAWVRHGPPGLVGKADIRPHVKELHAAESWDGLPYLEQRGDANRLYVCRCSAWLEVNIHYLRDPDPTPGVDPMLSWSCAGHAAPEPPITLHDVTMTTETDADDLVERILAGWLPRDLGKVQREGPALWLSWLYAYLLGLPLADAFSEAVAKRIEDPDPLTMGRVLYFFAHFPRAKGFDLVLPHAESHVDRVAVGYPIPETPHSPTFADVLVARLEHRSTHRDVLDERALSVFRQAMLVPLTELSHEEAAPSTELEAFEARIQEQVGVLGEEHLRMISSYKQMLEQARTDVIKRVLEESRHTAAFDEDDCLWLADHIVDIEVAAPGRWKSVMAQLVRQHRARPDLEHLIVIAGVRMVKSRSVSISEIYEWVERHGSKTDAWVLPILVSIEKG